MTQRDFIPEPLWRQIEDCLPITCVDVLPMQRGSGGLPLIARIGLIEREVVGVGRGWTLIGGRLRRGETLIRAVRRQIDETLLDVGDVETLASEPMVVAEYLPAAAPDAPHDPRHHAIGLAFCVYVAGAPTSNPRGEATEFRWFDTDRLPADHEFLFGQAQVVRRLLERCRKVR
jgi:ADP-ribose pyrophosphatase YjhB (NUDIX family)